MPKPKIIRQWIEIGQQYLLDGPPKRDDYEATVLLNRCVLRDKGNGAALLLRNVGMETFRAPSRTQLDEKVAAFAMREDVRTLAKGIEFNDFDTLPKEQKNPSQEMIDGTDDVYHVEEE